MVNKRLKFYWLAQIVGWILIYGCGVLFVYSVFSENMPRFMPYRIAFGVLFGLIFTHILRFGIHRLGLKPPMRQQKWVRLTFLIFIICVLYSLTNSAVVEYFQLYNPDRKATIAKRAIGEFMNITPNILLWVAIYYVWHYLEYSRKAEVQKLRLEATVKELELKTIKSHINPHFIFNALNSIRALVDENPERARTAITELSNILRSSMQAEKLETTSLEKELSIVKDYLALEHIRFEDRLKVEYDIDEDTLDQQVPPMMLQTLVENAIKHGIGKQKEGGIVKVISDFKENHHELVVRNTGHLNGATISSDGFGISSTQTRLKLLFGKKAFFEIKDAGDNIVEAKVIMPVALS